MIKLWDKYPKIKNKLDLFEDYLLDKLEVRPNLIKTAMSELANRGGKRIRPTLVIAAGHFKGNSMDKVFPVATAIEMIHMATLIHDDIIDESNLRRGGPTIQSRYGKDIAVFAGDYLFTHSFNLLSGDVEQQLLQYISRGIKYICEGEIDQYENRYNTDISLLQYLRRIRRKTAILFRASCFAGGHIINLKEEYQLSLAKYGNNLGMIFQITDDLLDIMGKEKNTGKPVGNDLKQGVYTLPVLYALKDEKLGAKINKLLQQENINTTKLITLIKKTKALEKSKVLLERYADRARKDLNTLPTLKPKRFLSDLLQFILERNF